MAAKVAAQGVEVCGDFWVVSIMIWRFADGKGHERGAVIFAFRRLPGSVVEVLPDPCAGDGAGLGLKRPGIIKCGAGGVAEVRLTHSGIGKVVAG